MTIDYDDAPIPPPSTRTRDGKRRRQVAYQATEQGRAQRRAYREGYKLEPGFARKRARDKALKTISRRFIGWDGEGVTDEHGRHRYVLLAASTGDTIRNPDGLHMEACFNLLLDVAARFPNAIHVGYGLNYDVNMMLGDLQRVELRDVVEDKRADVRGWRVSWRPGKQFSVRDLRDPTGERRVTMYDVISFFQCSFINACDGYLGDREQWQRDRALIVENKAQRSAFRVEDLDDIERYNAAELVNLTLLMRELRKRLFNARLMPRGWYGPGAVAAKLLDRENVKQHMCRDIPPDVARASRFAYMGGRFELLRFGHVDGPAYQYDINSAYPSAMRDLPSLKGGRWWAHVDEPVEYRDYSLYRVSWGAFPDMLPGPFGRRCADGKVVYPASCSMQWVWGVELNAAMDYLHRWRDTWRAPAWITVHEGWVYRPRDGDAQPFAFVEGVYNKRAALKKAGDGAHAAYKLGLNSMYGKQAQQIGWSLDKEGNPRVPTYHQLEWAGYVTAHCRAQLLRAFTDDPGAVIACETDAVFTIRPLPVQLGSGLGEWSETRYTSLTYLQSGCYAGVADDGTVDGAEVVKSRGFDRGDVTRDAIVSAVLRGDRELPAHLTRFIGAKVALAWGERGWRLWRRWVTEPKVMRLEPGGKREHLHVTCWEPGCTPDGGSPSAGLWHRTFCPVMDGGPSHEFPVEWINPDPDMTELSEFRDESPSQWEDE